MTGGLDQINDYYYIDPDIHTAGQPRVDQLDILRREKFEVVINLALMTSPDAIPDEQERVMELGMAYVHIPVEWETPNAEDFKKFCHFFGAYPNFKTFVHCVKNMRVSSFVFLYRCICESCNPSSALEDLLTLWKPNSVWQAFINAELLRARITWRVNWDTLEVVS